MRNPADDDLDPTPKPTRRRAPAGAGYSDQLQALQARKNQLESKIATLEARDAVRRRKDDTRCRILVGSLLLKHAEFAPQTLTFIQTVLAGATLTSKDREFLKSRGLLIP
jgi:hypothetical protein